AEIFFRLDVFGQFSGQCFEFVLVHLLTHEGILLKKLLIRGRLRIPAKLNSHSGQREHPDP
ncbi:hypothetical protein V8Z83_22375, partial [Aeromonas salmonicida subsp. salmonicida]|uniref:hypothetical protein n=1 Tax=Aeromonas salmonicida TaxID=645 RepID=UPI003FD1DACD